MRVLEGVLSELLSLTSSQPHTQAFLTQALLSLSDGQNYPAPVAFTLSDFKQVQASVFQVTKSPGKPWVYLGCVFLIIGIFAMLYVRERRLWVWLSSSSNQRTNITLALSTPKRSSDTDREFEKLQIQLGWVSQKIQSRP